jgi:hypothetical protein
MAFTRLFTDPRPVGWCPSTALLEPWVGCPVLLPLAVVVGLRAVWSAREPSVRIWGAVFGAAGAFGIAWIVLALLGRRPAWLPVLVEPVLWAGGTALGLSWLLLFVHREPGAGGVGRRLPALTLIAFVAGHHYLFQGGPIRNAVFLIDFDLGKAYLGTLRAPYGLGGALFCTALVVSLPALYLFLAVALRRLSLTDAFRSLVRGIRARPGLAAATAAVLILLSLVHAVAISLPWYYAMGQTESRGLAVLVGLFLAQIPTIVGGLVLWYASRTVLVMTSGGE